MRSYPFVLLTLASLLGGAGCATTTAPLKVGESTWMVTGSDSWALSSENAVIERLTKQAEEHCRKLGQSVEVVDAQSNKHYGHPAQGRVTYECQESDTADKNHASQAEDQ